jgi:lipoprotein-anchoring transpeptidase ErfK/SrfK
MRWLGVEASAGPGQIILEQPTQLLPHLTSTPEYTYLSSEPYQITPVSPFRFVLKILAVIFVIGILGLALGLSAAMFALAEPLIIPSAASRFPIRRDISLPAVVQPSSSSLEIPAVQNITPVEAIVSNASVEPNTEVAFIPPQHIEPAAAPLQTAALTVYPSDSSAAPPLLVGRTLPPEPVPVDPALLAYQPAYPGEKWIEVNVTMQQVTAWEGNLPVMSFKASTGKPDTPTILGQFHVYWKLQKTDMSGFNYYVPDVPYVMFFEGDYALHGTYWHNLFGHPISRGCVNLSIADAKKLFDWAGPAIPPGQTETVAGYDNPGTLIVVHD